MTKKQGLREKGKQELKHRDNFIDKCRYKKKLHTHPQ